MGHYLELKNVRLHINLQRYFYIFALFHILYKITTQICAKIEILFWIFLRKK